MTTNNTYLGVSDLNRLELVHEFDMSNDCLSIWVRVFDTRRGIKRGFRIAMTKELFEMLAEDVGEGIGYPLAKSTWDVPGYRKGRR